MDKNKSRTDMIAAGRKKLEKFRQKKDNKGSKSKSLDKVTKSGNESNADTSSKAVPQNAAEGEKPTLEAQNTIDFSELNAGVDSVANDAVAATDVLQGTDNIIDSYPSVEIQSDCSAVNEPRMNLNADDGCPIEYEIQQKGSSCMVTSDSECDMSRIPNTVLPGEISPSHGIPLGAYSLSQLEKPQREAQEVDCFRRNQNDEDAVVLSERDTSVSSSEHATGAGKEIYYTTPFVVPNDASFTAVADNNSEEAQKGYDNSNDSFLSVYSENVPVVRSEACAPEGKGLSADEKNQMHDVSGSNLADRATLVSPQVIKGRSLDFIADGHEKFIGSMLVDLPFGLEGGSIKLSQLAEILQSLDEDKFKFLFMSREMTPEKLEVANSAMACVPSAHGAFERLKDELYIASFARDAFHLQLSELKNFIDEISVTNASFIEIQEKNELLAEEIQQCRCEHLKVLSEREEMQKNLDISKAAVESVSVKVDKLQTKLEIAEGGLSRLLVDLVDCRNLVAALQAENEDYNGRFEMMTTEKKKLLEENENILLKNNNLVQILAECNARLESLQMENNLLAEDAVFLRDCRMRLEEEKDHIFCEKNNLFTGLAEYRSTVEALEAENMDLKEIFRSVSDDQKKLEEEKEFLVLKSMGLSKELTDCKDLVLTLQLEISNLHSVIPSINEEKIKYEEEREKFLSEYEKQWHDLTEIKVLEAILRAEYLKVAADLKEATLRIDLLTEENEILKLRFDSHTSCRGGFDKKKYSPQLEEVANLKNGNEILSFEKAHLEDKLSYEHLKLDIFDDSYGFVAMKRRLDDAGVVMKNLEKANEDMQLLVASSLNRPSDKVIAPGISRLIQAFESKSNELEPSSSSENQMTEDPYMMTKVFFQKLDAMLKDLVIDNERASEFCLGMKHNNLLLRSNVKNDLVEELTVELMVICEVLRQHTHHASANEGDLRSICNSLQNQEMVLKLENRQLREKLNDVHAKTVDLQGKLDKMHRESDEIVVSLSNQVKAFQTEVVDREATLEEEWNSVVAQVLHIVDELDSTVKTFRSTSIPDTNANPDVISRVSNTVCGATKVIEELCVQLEAVRKNHQATSNAFDDMHEKWNNLQGQNEMTMKTLNKLYYDLSELVISEDGNGVKDDRGLDLFHPDMFNTLLNELKKLFSERLQLQSVKKQLELELRDSSSVIEELGKKCIETDTMINLIEEVEQFVKPQGFEIHADDPISHLEFLIRLLVQKYQETVQIVSTITSLEVQPSDLQCQVEDLSFTLVQCENENLVFKQSLKGARDHLVALSLKIQEKAAELELSEQRVSSLREKLGIAVTKGKGLISQRDNLKQSLAETSKELEKCNLDLLSKDTRLHDLETKLKVYSEAGERMEALESELSYIRNSATALRESFLLKDSILQRIEEILEDLELPEHFHSRDIIEKIDWLAKSVTGNTLHPGDWDQRSSIGGGSYSDAGFVDANGLKEEMQLNPSSFDDLRRRYEELQSKFYGLAEQNEMLEQSLVERNNLVQRWEEILGQVDIPSQMRSVEPEDKIQWFKQALTESLSKNDSLQVNINTLENLCESLTADLQDSNRRMLELDAAFQQVCGERETLSRDLELVTRDKAEILMKASNFKTLNNTLQNEVSMLQEQKLQTEKDIHHTKNAIKGLQDLVKDAFQNTNTNDVACVDGDTTSLEEQLKKLVDRYTTLLSEKHVNSEDVDVHVTEKSDSSNISRNIDEQELEIMGKKLEDAMEELICLKDEKDRFMQNTVSLVHQVEQLEINKSKLQELLNQEELKTTSLREKLNVAVRKGKSLVQQRDGMKQVIEELNAEIQQLKSEIKHSEKAMFEFEEKNKELSIMQEKIKVLEFENASLRNRIVETEHSLQEKEGSLSSVLNTLDEVDFGLVIKHGNPIEKIREIGTHFHDLSAALNFAEQESRKSKRAAELLLAELNEVQERNDIIQEELTNAATELSELSREKNSVEAARYEVLAHAEKLSSLLKEKEKQLSEVMVINSGVNRLREDLFAFENELENALSKDREVLHKISYILESYVESGDSPDLTSLSPGETTVSIRSKKLESQLLQSELVSLNQQLYKHSQSLHEEICHLLEVMKDIHREFYSLRESNESMKKDVKLLESIGKTKESEVQNLKEGISLLYDACAGVIFEMENWKDRVDENALTSRDSERKSAAHVLERGPHNINDDVNIFTKTDFKSMHDKVLLVVKGYISTQNEFKAAGHKEMKSTIMNLQKELQEKDIQRERICMELVEQIKEAEFNSKNYLQDLQQARAQIHEFQTLVDVRENDVVLLKRRVDELQNQEANCSDLLQKVNSLTDTLTSKEQETEALMQALDEEEAQMEDLVIKIGGLETELKEKNQNLENLEATRTKTLKKLSVTMSKFDELHYLSENLLSEVEKLQSQLLERDEEISFLRQEVTRCTNDALTVTQMSKKSSDETEGLLTWLDTMISGVKVNNTTSDDTKIYQVTEYKEALRKQIVALISEIQSLRLTSKDNDVMLQEERKKVEELTQKQWHLENSLRNKESEIVILQGSGDSAKANSTSEIVEVEPITNKRASPGAITPQVRSLRKGNNDQIAIAIDVDHSYDKVDLDDDDKAHGFKSLTTSKVVPRFTRPVSDMIDGLWVSCDRALMRRPVLRLGIIIYWAVLHSLLAAFVV